MNAWPQNYTVLSHQLHAQLVWQGQKLSQLEKTMETLQKELQTLKEQPYIRIDRVEYSFDQLKIERMDGTLNIGLTPQTMKDIAELSVNGKTVPQPGAGDYPPDFGELRDHIHTYLFEEVPKIIEALETRHHQSLSPAYREMIIQDLQKQIDGRIVHYMNLWNPSDPFFDSSTMKETVMAKVKQDIVTALENHFTQSPKKESDLP